MKEELLKSSLFKEIVRSKNSISLILTVLELIIYFGFVLLVAYNKEFLGEKLYGSVTVGIPIGIGVIILSWLLTGIYVLWSNKVYDEKVSKIREKIGGE
ncbi:MULTISPECIES: DUF485 domain-containing protein [Thermodesulfovibrio]|jgi:uncharacterized membrane protein (DUF485 family)|uniref:Inner membrane protein YjcH n=2 Tax=Thermodesulfovibrio yellowstonii TaxID=28262 RepID=B5YGV5_THEYD|nr:MULTISPECIES: DUF485 domain-containing protein [Thermodesulfovibrio]ACI21147.1 inner membrane protein YjcH [Thermodesulfovibrio yellowstonii DSM 11347]MDI6865408.1 DUF485 domain-containing protein [Thermodesulfovibrio yellowstonii]GLI52560.1 hypothetical protein TISLANDTSLP1_02530 [Thermodesulfovibrio islandicus]